MSDVNGIWETELEDFIAHMKGLAGKMTDHSGRSVVVRLKWLDPGRCGENKY